MQELPPWKNTPIGAPPLCLCGSAHCPKHSSELFLCRSRARPVSLQFYPGPRTVIIGAFNNSSWPQAHQCIFLGPTIGCLLSTDVGLLSIKPGCSKNMFRFFRWERASDSTPCIWACKPARHRCLPLMNKARVPEKFISISSGCKGTIRPPLPMGLQACSAPVLAFDD